MDFFLHATLNRFSRKLNLIKKHYGIAGLGYYWLVVEKLLWEGQKVNMKELIALRDKPIRYSDAKDIILKSGLFIVDEQDNVILANDLDNGISKNTMDNYLGSLLMDSSLVDVQPKDCWDDDSCECTGTCTEVGASAGAEACAEVCAEACADPSADAGTYVFKNKDKDLDKDKDLYSQAGKERIEKNLLDEYMDINYPHLQLMDEPLKLYQFRMLQKSYNKEQIEDILQQMENSIDLYSRKRSCYLTALSWLKHTYGNNNNKQ